MYTAFYGLREKPFALSPDPRFLYLAGSHREALAHLLYGIEQGEGFISVTGEVGTGKTTLCRTLLERLDGDTELAFLFNPSRSALELLQTICAEFGLPAEGLTRRSLMNQLNGFLVKQKSQNRRVLLIIDEAQNLSENTLEQVRLLSNLETSREKLIQILLLGQPELDRKLDGRGLRQLRQRISVRWKLEPLSAEETRAYVRHRLAIAAGEPKDLFSDAALRDVHRRTGGVPRLVNQLCDRALLAGYAARVSTIRPALVRAAAREIPDARRRAGHESRSFLVMRPWLYVAATLATVGLALVAGLQVGRHGLAGALGDGSDPGSEATAGSAAEVRVANADGMPPAVGANMPTNSAVEGDEPPLARLIGYVPKEIRDDLRPLPGEIVEVESESEDGLVTSRTSVPIPEAPRLSVTALAPGLLPRLLANRNAEVAMAESQRVMLERYGRLVPAFAKAPTDPEELRRGLESRGLVATSFDGGSIELLRHLDHPVLLPLAPTTAADRRNDPNALADAVADGRWLAITGFENDRVRVAGLLADRIVTVPAVDIEAHWLETGMIVWEQYESVPEMLGRGDEGDGVVWLQRALAELGYFEGPNGLDAQPSGRFDGATLRAVANFQRKQGLVADGLVGPLTQIALYAQLDRYPVPRLSRVDSVHATESAANVPSAIPAVSAPRASATPDAASPQEAPRSDLAPRSGDRG
jgi:general secretion pathway protein A